MLGDIGGVDALNLLRTPKHRIRMTDDTDEGTKMRHLSETSSEEHGRMDSAKHQDEALRWKVLCLCRQKGYVRAIASCMNEMTEGLSEDTQKWFLKTCIHDEMNEMYPCSKEYTRRLLQCVVAEIEKTQHVVTDELADELVTAMIRRREDNDAHDDVGTWTFKVYTYAHADGTSRDRIVIHAAKNVFEGSTGCFEWDAGYFLAEYILNSPHEFKGVCVELGSGVGMVGVVLSRVRGAQSPGMLMCTDGDWETLNNCEMNLRENSVPVMEPQCSLDDHGSNSNASVVLKQFQWEQGWESLKKSMVFEEQTGTVSQETQEQQQRLIMVGADLLYDPNIIPTMVPLIRHALEDAYLVKGWKDSSVYLSTRKRNEVTLQKFFDAIEDQGCLYIEDITDDACMKINNGIRFCHIQSLDDSRDEGSILLHKIQYKPNLV